MAAAASTRSKGRLFFLLSLLCLVGLASSRKDDMNLDNFKAQIQKAEEKLNQLKAQKDFLSTLMSQTKTFTEQRMAALEKLLSEHPADDDLPLKNLFQSLMHSFDLAKTFFDKENEVSDAEITNMKLDLEKTKRFVQALEEYHSEL